MNKIIVIGGNHHNTLGVIRSLGRKGIHPIVIIEATDNKPFVGKSKYISEIYVVSTGKQVIELLYHLQNDMKAILIACSDEISSLLDLHRNELVDKYILPGITDQGKLTELMNKQVMCDLAMSVGLDVPKSCFVNRNIQDYSDMQYPCIIKPLVSKDGKKSDIKICESSNDLLQYDFSSNPSQIQQYIDKTFEYQLIGCSINEGKEVIVPGRTIIIHQPNNTNTAFLHYEPLDGSEPMNKCINFLLKVRYSGLFSMEFLRGKDGKDYFMEINFRNDGNSISVTDAGVNLPYIWVLSCLNKDYHDEVSCPRPIYVIPEKTIIDLWYKGTLSTKEMIKDFIIAETYMDYAKDDPKPSDNPFSMWLTIIKLTPKVLLKTLFKLRK